MASFSSGVMISKSEAERRRGDELRMRKQGLDPSRDDQNWGGAVICRRQHRQTRVEKENEKEREEAEHFQLDLKEVILKRPENRLKWLHRALALAGKKRVQFAAIYDIVQHRKFVDGISQGLGRQMRTLLLANLHLFSQKQQRALQSDSCRFNSFTSESDYPISLTDTGDANRSGRRAGSSRSSSRDRSASYVSRSRGSPHRERSNRRANDDRVAEGRGSKRAIRRSASGDDRAGIQADSLPADSYLRSRNRNPPNDDKAPMRLGLKMKVSSWQPHVLRDAATLPP